MPNRTERGSNFPQLGAEAVRHQPISKKTGQPKLNERGNPEIVLKFPGTIDFKNPANVAAATATFAHSIETAPRHFVESGKMWYPNANQEVQTALQKKGFLRHASDPNLTGAAILASVSPNTDWDARNSSALKAVQGARSSHWKTIMSAQEGTASHAEALGVFSGTALSNAKLPELQKIGRLVQGEDPNTVINRRTAPKTHSFMHNIADPSNPHHVTIDGRAFDTLTNRARPWEFGRGLSSANLTTGTSRYEDITHIVQGVARSMNLDPSAAQAVSWEHTKYGIEQKNRTRKQGPARVGQPYFHPQTGQPMLHMSGGQFS